MQYSIGVYGQSASHKSEIIALIERLGYIGASLNACMEIEPPQENPLYLDAVIAEIQSEDLDCELSYLTRTYPEIPVIVLVPYGDYALACQAIRQGASDFLTKPVAYERMQTTLRNMILLKQAEDNIRLLKQSAVDGFVQKGAHYLPLVERGHMRKITAIEGDVIRMAMQFYQGKLTEVARRLGIGRSTLYRKLQEMNRKQLEAA